MASTPRKKDLSVSKVSEKQKVISSVPKKLTSKKSLERNNKKNNSKKSVKSTVSVTRAPISLTQDTAVTEAKIIISNGTKKKEKEKSVVVRSKINLALLSPYRLTVPNEQLVSGTARYAGIFLVVVGGLFSLLNLDFVNGDFAKFDAISQKAELSGSTINVSPTLATTEPEVQFVSISNEPLHGTVEVKLRVDNITQISIKAIKENIEYPLGYMLRINNSDSYWSYLWDTTQLQDGDYRLKVVLTGDFGSLEKVDTVIYRITNTDTTPPDDTEATVLTPSISMQILEDAPVTGGVPIKIFVTDSDEVKVNARNTLTGTRYTIGYATRRDENEWSVTWDSTKVPDGNYELKAFVKVNGTIFDSAKSITTVDNVKDTNDEATHVIEGSSTTSLSNNEEKEAENTELLEPKINLSFSKESPLSNFVELHIDVSGVFGEKVGIYAMPKNSLTPYILGIAEKISENKWIYIWNTNQTPNGEYAVFARAKTLYGDIDGSRTSVQVQNQSVVQFNDTQEKEIDLLYQVNNNLVKIVEENQDDEISKTDDDIQINKPEIFYIQSVEDFIDTFDTEDTEDSIHVGVQELLLNFRKKLNTQLTEYARAEREGDQEKIVRIKAEIEKSREDTLRSLPSGVEKKELIDSIDSYLSKISFELEEVTIKNEKILKERIGDKVLKDSDKDNISDYDEVNLYLTDPFSADTDGDGYIDSAEISLGYDPHDSTSEALVAYESPKDTGVIREDLFVIKAITTLPKEKDVSETDNSTRAIISGVGLPNSFVTLYIFSTPIVVTVKTDADGSWSYIFDKDLEDGEHEVYAAITDNVGRVIAKSNPLPFVKTAEAFTATGAVTQAVDSSTYEPSLLKSKALLLVASISVVALGLVLLLLGFHVKGKREDEIPTV